jgi:hypothetical protein
MNDKPDHLFHRLDLTFPFFDLMPSPPVQSSSSPSANPSRMLPLWQAWQASPSPMALESPPVPLVALFHISV